MKNIDCDSNVIAITTHASDAIHSREIDSARNLSGPCVAGRFNNAAPEFLHTEYRNNNKIEQLEASSRVLLRDGDTCHWIHLQDIVYFESCANHTVAFWSSNKAFVYCAIGIIEMRLPKCFFRVSRQHIVNIESVNSVELWINGGYRLYLKTGVYIEVSRRRAKRFKESFSL